MNKQPRIVVTDQPFGNVNYEQAVAGSHGASFDSYQCKNVEETRHATEGADVVFVNFAPITRDVLEGLAEGAVVVRYGVGYDNVDIVAAKDLGVRVANVPDYGIETVADHTVSLLLASLRKINQYDRHIRNGSWVEPSRVGSIASFASTTVGLVGTGKIGLKVAERLKPFGFDVLAYDPYAPKEIFGPRFRQVELEDLLSKADAISLHCPLNQQTQHIINASTIAQMRHGAVLVNTSRGGLVDEASVADALVSGQLGGAALDVFDPEPLAEESPLRTHPNAILTPHVAFYSDQSLDNLQRLAAEEADRALSAKPLRCAVA